MTFTSPSNGLAIRAANTTKSFGSGAGIAGLDLEVEPGKILGLIGPSGSGKTTTVRLLAGLLAPDGGELEVLGQVPTRFTSDIRQRIGYLPQECVLYPTLTLEENLLFSAAMYGLTGRDRRQRVAEVLDIVELAETKDRRLADSSGGMKRRAGLAAALVHQPDLLFLDEPTAGVDPILRQTLWNEFQGLRDAGATLVVTTQYVGEAAMCDEIVLLSDGTVAARGTPEGLRRDAYGGEIIDVRFDRSPSRAEVDRIADGIGAISYNGTGLGEVEFVVEDAGTAAAEIHRVLEGLEMTIVEVERRYPDFDDVFVRIVGQHREQTGALR
jgi:ABC-2 type transport system ATP-binding protein